MIARLAVAILVAVPLFGQTLEKLKSGETRQGFQAIAVYLNNSDQPMGARFVHARTGFTLDLLQIETAPQAQLWVNTFPVSNMGEPHTQEHLLLGSGNKGRNAATVKAMSLVTSGAYTEQLATVYHFNTVAGPDVFFRVFETTIDSLLHPDYTDEEIRREVRNFGVSEAAGRLRLEEKGSVYNEMTSSTTRPGRLVYYASMGLLYGKDHPLARNAGGDPEGIRVMEPSHIRQFHQRTHFLKNMGAVIALPKNVEMDSTLGQLNSMFDRLQTQPEARQASSRKNLQRPQPAPSGSFLAIEYPSRSETQASPVYMAWPAQLELGAAERLLASVFVDSFAGDATTNLYKLLVDTKTRKLDIGVKSINGHVSDDLGNPIVLILADVSASHLNQESLHSAGAVIIEELKRIAAWQDGSRELLEFNERVRGQLLQARRQLDHFVNSPPQFGFRNGSQPWNEHLETVSESTDFRRSVTLKPHIQTVGKLLESGKNIWREKIAAWKLTESAPYTVAARPSPAMITRLESERQSRNNVEAARLQAQYGVSDMQEAIQRYKTEYDAKSKEIQALNSVATAKFIEDPPLSMDDQLQYEVRRVRGRTPVVISTFESMTSGSIGLALNIDAVPADQLVFAALLPQLLTTVGVIQNGKPIPYEQMAESIRKEILSLTAAFQTNVKTERAELVLRASGSDARESVRAVEWMAMALDSPYWQTANLPRIRDVIDQRIGQLRRTMQSAEESWVRQPASAWRRQNNPALLTAGNFLTQTYYAYRLRWMLSDPATNKDAVIHTLAEFEKNTPADRASVRQRLAAWKKTPANDFARDLEEMMADVPDDSLVVDLKAICRQMQQDLQFGPDKALAALNAVRRLLLHAENARMFLVASPAVQTAVLDRLESLSGLLNTTKLERPVRVRRDNITDRIRTRDKKVLSPLFAGLLAPSLTGGVIMNLADGTKYEDTSRQALVDYLAAVQYSGGGSHTAFSRTTAAGLAYSNGVNASPHLGQVTYYAERTPEIPLTTRFVVDLIRSAKYDPSLAEYAIARAFSSRTAGSYESRAEAMADDLADKITPELVSRFRKALLALRRNPTLGEDIHQRLPIVLSRVLPGLGTSVKSESGGSYFVIGAEKQMSAYEEYLKSAEGADTRLYRLYPRDFWLVN